MIGVAHSMKMAYISLKSSKTRSFLTALGIIIGIAAVVGTWTLGAGFNSYMTEQIGEDSSNFIVVAAKKDHLFYDQQLQIVKNTPGITDASPLVGSGGVVEFMGEQKNISQIYGVLEDYSDVASVTLSSGGFITNSDTSSAVVGKKIAAEMFNNEISDRSTIKITVYNENTKEYVTETFKVKGISAYEEDGGILKIGSDIENTIYIPVKTAQRMTGQDDYQEFYAAADTGENVSEVSDDVETNLARNLGVSERFLNDPGYEDLIPFVMINQADIMNQMQQLIQTLQTFLIGIGGISLVVGSVGIMNIMLVTVTERTREIGTLKALGYSLKDILFLFVIEAITVSLFGGAVGVFLGVLMGYAGSALMGFQMGLPVTPIVGGIILAIIIGVMAGVYPANKAAKMNPVDALRSD
ncbi:Macrolide export ATP-binding/permease protein MacB [Methanosarcinaceae archaeon Ag5]|uniref:Macrolide export ATP-binding/permease protein MacB n=1 Tax=Methanolapillus africanus TaxID=3028297 RepID=A0AAE4MKQ2_9EURY|nr:Macrolide export ATP-binding/permease protein MacB [Methanosarcinaceae archaeon Ag5]